jgi:hypothetical protein
MIATRQDFLDSGMSVEAHRRARLLWIYLFHMADAEGMFSTRLADLAADCNLTVKQTRDALWALKEMKEIRTARLRHGIAVRVIDRRFNFGERPAPAITPSVDADFAEVEVATGAEVNRASDFAAPAPVGVDGRTFDLVAAGLVPVSARFGGECFSGQSF